MCRSVPEEPPLVTESDSIPHKGGTRTSSARDEAGSVDGS
jgi:hypothetical protein